jgi:hypothetical protein
VTDFSGLLELQVVDLRCGGGTCLIAQERPVLAVGRALDFVPIPFSIEGPADLATGKIERFLQIDLPPLRASLGLVIGTPTALRIAVVFSTDELHAGLFKARLPESAAQAGSSADNRKEKAWTKEHAARAIPR